MVICDLLLEKGKKVIYRNEKPRAFDRETLIDDMFCRLQNGPCNKLVRRSLYTDNNISYPQGLNYGEDQLVNLKLLMAGASVSYVPKALYHYDCISNLDSASRGVSPHSKKEYYAKFSGLKSVRWKDYRKIVFSIKLIIWTSLHVSYGLALFMYGIKRTKKRLGL